MIKKTSTSKGDNMNTQTELGISLQREAILSKRLMHCLHNGLDLDMVEDDQPWK